MREISTESFSYFLKPSCFAMGSKDMDQKKQPYNELKSSQLTSCERESKCNKIKFYNIFLVFT